MILPHGICFSLLSFSVSDDTDVKMKAILIGAVFLVVSFVIIGCEV